MCYQSQSYPHYSISTESVKSQRRLFKWLVFYIFDVIYLIIFFAKKFYRYQINSPSLFIVNQFLMVSCIKRGGSF